MCGSPLIFCKTEVRNNLKIGASTACLYPLETEIAIKKLSDTGIKNIEIFFNADCELRGKLLEVIKKAVADSGCSVMSVHPYTSAVETISLFGDYPRRLEDILDTYKRYFEIMNIFGAKIFVLHGALKSAVLEDEVYFQRYSMLYEIGKGFGVTVAQENVSYCKGGSSRFLLQMKKTLGDECGFVLDVKQALRSGTDAFSLLELLGDSIVHCHISDNNAKNDCVPVGKGSFELERFAGELEKISYGGNIVLELYKDGFESLNELKKSIEYMEGCFRKERKL